MTTKDPNYDRYAGIVSLPDSDGKMPRPFRVDEDGKVIYLDQGRGTAQPIETSNERARAGITDWDELDRKLDEEHGVAGRARADNPIQLAETGNPNWNGYEAMRAQGQRDGARLRDTFGSTRSRSADPASDGAFAGPLERPSVEMMTTATNDALRAVGGGNLKSGLSSGLNTEFSRMDGLPDFSQGNWKKAYSTHASEAYEHLLPGNSGMAVKVYLRDREHDDLNTATITAPTESIGHISAFPFYYMGFPVNSRNAAIYLAGKRIRQKVRK